MAKGFGDLVLIDAGVKHRREIATKELLDNKNTPGRYQLGGRDALGAPIREGHRMDWLDDKTPGFFVYVRVDTDGRWLRESWHEEEDAAVARAKELAADPAAAVARAEEQAARAAVREVEHAAAIKLAEIEVAAAAASKGAGT